MSLSPLYPAQTSDLHVSTVEDPPSEFLPTSVHPGIDHHLSGLIIHALAPIPRANPRQERYRSKIAFATRYSLHMNHTCMYDKLRGPCFKTGGLTAFLIIVLPNSRGKYCMRRILNGRTMTPKKSVSGFKNGSLGVSRPCH